MQTYRYANGPDGDPVDVFTTERGAGPWTCAGCGRPMIFRHGPQRARHFAHKSQGGCSRETYLHIMAKNVFLLTFRERQRAARPFLVSLPAPLLCPRALESGNRCGINSHGCTRHDPVQMDRYVTDRRKEYDLTTKYDSILLEKKNGQFVPDLLLTRASGGRLYVEIKVRSGVSDEKVNSGVRIWEIDVKSEEDISRIASVSMTDNSNRCYNFNVERAAREAPPDCILALEDALWERNKERTLRHWEEHKRRQRNERKYIIVPTSPDAENTTPPPIPRLLQQPVHNLLQRETEDLAKVGMRWRPEAVDFINYCVDTSGIEWVRQHIMELPVEPINPVTKPPANPTDQPAPPQDASPIPWWAA